jgi:DNA-binding CsgD family transcriptional regulator
VSVSGSLPAYPSASHVPRSLGAAFETMVAARGQAKKLMAVFNRSPIPMVLVDNGRRYVEVNRPGRLLARSTLEEMRQLTIDDRTPPDEIPILEAVWGRMRKTGCVAGPRVVAGGTGTALEIFYWGMANALPGLHLYAFAPADWSEDEVGGPDDELMQSPSAPLTPREREVLQLAAEGLSGPDIAERLVLSPATVKTHFSNIYASLGVTGRVGAVARGMRLGLIA